VKQAILILAYKDIPQLIDMIECFDADFQFYIHIKKSSKIDALELEQLKSLEKVAFVSRKYEVKWGGYNLLKAILHLSREALKNTELSYFHLISGQDFPIKNTAYFKTFLKKNQGKQFIEYVSPPDARFLKRLSHYYFFDLINAKTGEGNKKIFTLIKLQRRLGLKRKPPMISHLAVGSAWWTLSYDCLKYIIDYTAKKPQFYQRLKYTWCPEEFYFQTVLLNSPFNEKLVNDNLRYIDWTTRNGSKPVILDSTDLHTLLHSEKIFARKFERPVSDLLLQKIKAIHKIKNNP